MWCRPARLGALVLVIIALSAHGAEFSDGVAAYKQGDYATAAALFSELAANGHRDAQNNLGVLYESGQGLQKDERQAANWYRLAAQQDQTDALVNLAALYESGRGVTQDDLEAYQWYQKAAQNGDSDARRRLENLAKRLPAKQIESITQQITTPAPATISQPTATATVTQAYGPVLAQETLWSIATKLKPADANTAQMILAIMQLNPQAFSSPSPASLQAGARLRLPASDAVRTIDPEQARTEVQRLLGQ